MSSTQEQRAPCHKRWHDETSLWLEVPFILQPSKRLKSSTCLHSAAFYDSLSKVSLTRRALKELNRRTRHAYSPQQSTYVRRNVDQEDIWKEQIQKFARHGGPELRDLRGYPASTNGTRMMDSSSSRQTKSTNTKRTPSNKRTSAYDRNFEWHLNDNHIYIRNRKPRTAGLEELGRRLTQKRPSLVPSCFSDTSFESFYQKNEDAIDEGEIMRDVVPIIAGNSNILSKQDLLFTRLDSITNKTTVNAKPDFYDGARLAEVNKKVRDDIGTYIVPTGHRTAPVAPNFFLEVKGPAGATDVAKRQVCYDGALGARAMHKLQSYKQVEPEYDGNAYTVTSTFHDGQLRIYTTHPIQSIDGATEYHTFQVGAWAMTDSLNSFRHGATAFRNAREWAQEKRNGFISVANERAKAAYGGLSSDDFVFSSSDEEENSFFARAEGVRTKESMRYSTRSRCFRAVVIFCVYFCYIVLVVILLYIVISFCIVKSRYFPSLI